MRASIGFARYAEVRGTRGRERDERLPGVDILAILPSPGHSSLQGGKGMKRNKEENQEITGADLSSLPASLALNCMNQCVQMYPALAAYCIVSYISTIHT